MMFRFFSFYIYLTRCRMKRRGETDRLRRNARNRINRVKRRVYERQNGRCCVCGHAFPADRLNVHHILSVATHPWLIASEKNIRLACRDCHIKIHQLNKESI